MAYYPAIKDYNGSYPTSYFNTKLFTTNTIVADNVNAGSVNAGNVSSNSSVISLVDPNNPLSITNVYYVDNKIDSVISGASESYDTFKEIETFLKSNDNAIVSINNSLNSKANVSTVNDLSSNLFNNYYNKTSVDTSLATKASDTVLNDLSNNLFNNYYNKSSVDTSLATKASNAVVNDLSGNLFNNYYNKTSVDTALLTKASNTVVNDLSNNLLNNYYNKTSVDTALLTKQPTLIFDAVPTTSSINVVNSGNIKSYVDTKVSDLVSSAPSTLDTLNELANALGNDPNFATTVTTLIGTKAAQTSLDTMNTNVTNLATRVNVTETDISGIKVSKQNVLTFDSTPITLSTNPVTSGGIFTALQSYLTTTLASSTYAPINNANLTGITGLTEVSEGVFNAGSGTNLSLSYTGIKGVIYYSPANNFTLTLSSVPTTSTLSSYTMTFIYNAKFYCNSIVINGTSRTMVSAGGISNVAINSSATYVMQQISIMYLNSSTPTVITNILSLW